MGIERDISIRRERRRNFDVFGNEVTAPSLCVRRDRVEMDFLVVRVEVNVEVASGAGIARPVRAFGNVDIEFGRTADPNAVNGDSGNVEDIGREGIFGRTRNDRIRRGIDKNLRIDNEAFLRFLNLVLLFRRGPTCVVRVAR